jgi:hypothetical protein
MKIYDLHVFYTPEEIAKVYLLEPRASVDLTIILVERTIE